MLLFPGAPATMFQLILNFHGVGPVPRDLDDGEHDCWLDLEQLEQVLEMVKGRNDVQLTFDDGNASDVEVALPALRRRKLVAAFFVCSGRLDAPTFLSRAQVCELSAQGMHVGSHGKAHRSWRGLDVASLKDELAGSRQVLEGVCGVPVHAAACPFGAYDRRALSMARAAGYRQVFTSDGGWARAGAWLMTRNTIRRSTSLSDVRRLLSGRGGMLERVGLRGRQLLKSLR